MTLCGALLLALVPLLQLAVSGPVGARHAERLDSPQAIFTLTASRAARRGAGLRERHGLHLLALLASGRRSRECRNC